MINNDAARDYGRRNPGDDQHRALLRPADRRPPLDLTAARAQLAASRQQTPAAVPPATAWKGRHPLDVGAVRQARESARAARTRPVRPPGAMVFATAGGWRWTHVDGLLGGRQWERLSAALVTTGPFESLAFRSARLDGEDGRAEFRTAADGTQWATIVIDDRLGRLERQTAIAHELAHVADYVASGAWAQVFTDVHRCRSSEEFAYAAESWLRPETPVSDLLAAARRHALAAGHGR